MSAAHTHPYLSDTHPASGVTSAKITNWDTAYTHSQASHAYLPLSGGKLTGSLEINSTGSSWNEGIRVHLASNNWCGLVLCGSDNTGNSGTSPNTWSIHNNNGIFGMYRNGSNTSATTYLTCISNAWSTNANFTAPNFYSSSDIRLKENIKDISNDLQMPQIHEFTWKETGNKSYGFIAQELELLGYDELVCSNGDDMKSVNYEAALSLVVGKLINEVKQLRTEINELKNK